MENRVRRIEIGQEVKDVVSAVSWTILCWIRLKDGRTERN